MVFARPLLGIALLLAVAYVFVPLMPGDTAEWIGVPVVLLFTVVVPGLALVRITHLRPGNPVEAAAHACANGLVFLLVAAFAWTLTGVSLDAFRFAVPLLVFAVCAAVPPRDKTRVDALRPRLPRFEKALLALFTVLALAPAIGVAISGPPLEITNDTIDHAGYVAEIARTGDPFPTTAIYATSGADGEDFRKALLHAIYGFVVAHTGASPTDVFAVGGAFLLLVMTFVVYAASRSLLRHRVAAAVAAGLFLVGSDWNVGTAMVRAAFYPNRFGAAFLLFFIAAAVEYTHRGPKTALRWCVWYAFAATAVHVQYAVLCAGVAGILILWKTCSPCERWSEHLSRTLRVALAAVAGALPFALFRFLTAFQTNPLHAQVQGAVYVSERWFMADPTRLWQTFGPLGIAALACIGPLWAQRRQVPGVGYAVAAFVTYLVIELVPFVLTPTYAVLKYLAFRLDSVAPYYLLPAYFIATWKPGARVTKAIVVVVLIVIILPLMRRNAFTPSVLEAERRRGPDRWARGLYELAESLPPHSLIASDPVTSYLISAFTPHYVVCTLDQHAPPNDLRVEARMSAARDILSPFTSAREKDRLIRTHRVTHVVVNRALPPGLILNYWTLEPRAAEESEEMFRSLRYEFQPTELGDGLTAFRWRSEERLSTLPRPTPRPVVAALPASATVIGAPAGEAVLEGAVIHGARIIPSGGELVLDLYWSRPEAVPPGTYVVTVRLDRKVLPLPFDGKPFPKVTRKLLEIWRNERYRFREDHMMVGGLFGPDAWSPDEIVEDDVRVRVPVDVAPGRYRVSAKMLRVAHQPNHRVRDFLYDDDTYSGVEIGEVTIQLW
jgi:hypothetical protein